MHITHIKRKSFSWVRLQPVGGSAVWLHSFFHFTAVCSGMLSCVLQVGRCDWPVSRCQLRVERLTRHHSCSLQETLERPLPSPRPLKIDPSEPKSWLGFGAEIVCALNVFSAPISTHVNFYKLCFHSIRPRWKKKSVCVMRKWHFFVYESELCVRNPCQYSRVTLVPVTQCRSI